MTTSIREMTRRTRVILGASVSVLVVVVVVGLVAFNGRRAHEVSLDDAVARAQPSLDGDGSRVGRPSQGVYRYEGTGSEKLSLMAGSQPIGPTVPVTVTWRDDGCWVFRVDFNSNHWQTWTYCQDGDTMSDHGGEIFQRFDFVVMAPESHSTSTCDPPAVTVRADMEPGQSWPQECTIDTDRQGTSRMEGPLTFIGVEPVEVGGLEVSANHFEATRAYDGSQHGTAELDTWFAVDTGLPLRSEWRTDITSSSPIGDVGYTEQGSWWITDLVPTT